MTAAAAGPTQVLEHAFALPLEGVRLVEASAGTGKTFTLTALVLRLVLERQLSPRQILVVTYTRAATSELRERVRARLRDALGYLDGEEVSPRQRLDAMYAWLDSRAGSRAADRAALVAAVRGLDEAAIFTIHGFCQRALSEHAFESGQPFDAELVTDERDLLDEIVVDFWAGVTYGLSAAELAALTAAEVDLPLLRLLAPAAAASPAMEMLPLPDALADDLPEAAAADPSGDAAAEAASGRAIEPALAALRQAVAVVAASWPEAEAEVRRRLDRPPALNKTEFSERKLAALFAALDPWLRRAAAGPDGGRSAGQLLELPPHFELLSAAHQGLHTNKNRVAPHHPFFVRCAEVMAAHDQAVAAARRWGLRLCHRLVAYVRRELPRRKQLAGQLGFDDLLSRLERALLDPARGEPLATRLRAAFPAALIDEFQDTDPLQYRIFARLYGARPAAGVARPEAGPLVLVGDPKQAIYAFRGADVQAYLLASRRADGTATLGVNHRSDPLLVEAINAVFSRVPEPFLDPAIRFQPVVPRDQAKSALVFRGDPRPPLQLRFVARTEGRRGGGPEASAVSKEWAKRHLPAVVAAEIARLLAPGEATLDGRPLEAGDIAVLVDTHRNGNLVQEALAARRIPAVLHGEASVLHSREAEELLRVVRAAVDPGDGAAVRAALCTPIFGLAADEVLALRDAGQERAWQERVDAFVRTAALWRERGLLPALRRLLDEAGTAARLLGLPDGERRMTNLLHLGELLQHESESRGRGPAGLLSWFERVHADPAEYRGPAEDAAQVRLESDEAAVQVITMHKCKGLQFPLVLCPYLWDGQLLRADDAALLRFHPAPGLPRQLALARFHGQAERERLRRLAEREAAAERLRLCYVALTRARHHCVVYFGGFRELATSPLGYLLAQPAAAGLAVAEEPGGRWLALPRQLKGNTDEQLRALLEALCKSAPGAIGLAEVEGAGGEAAPAGAVGAGLGPPLSARRFGRRLDDSWRTTSFSSIAGSTGPNRPGPAAAEGLDRDGTEAAMEEAASPARATLPLLRLPVGARTGRAVHEVLERWDFTSREAPALAALCSERLRRHGLPAALGEPLAAALLEALDTELPGLCGAAPFRLRQVTLGQRASELGFFLPLGGGMEPDGRAPLDVGRLASAFARAAAPPLSDRYAERLAAQPFVPALGFLRGFIDLVFEHQGRFYLVDYKSNHLGARPEDYAPDRLLEEMTGSHYVLQYHLYALAVHRLLAQRIDGYDYDQHFGGVYYLFLRGMRPAHRPGSGVFADRPPRALLDALSSVLDGEGA